MANRARKLGKGPIPVDYMTRTERVAAAVAGDEVDRVPVCFWHHFSPEGSGRAMADATLRFFDQEFDLDIAKVMPDIPYPFPQRSIEKPNDWRLIEPIDPGQSRFFRERAEAVASIRDVLGLDTPVIMTVFSPLAEAMYAARDRNLFLAHLEEQPALMHEVLTTIALNLNNHIRDIIAAGADGVFFEIEFVDRRRLRAIGQATQEAAAKYKNIKFIAGIGGLRGGIGYVITAAAAQIKMPYLFAAALTSSVLGIIIFILVSMVSARFLRHWHESAVRREL